MSAAFWAGFVLGVFALAMALVVVINVNQTPPPRPSLPEPPQWHEQAKGGDA
jgi:hypothetical protein